MFGHGKFMLYYKCKDKNWLWLIDCNIPVPMCSKSQIKLNRFVSASIKYFRNNLERKYSYVYLRFHQASEYLNCFKYAV